MDQQITRRDLLCAAGLAGAAMAAGGGTFGSGFGETVDGAGEGAREINRRPSFRGVYFNPLVKPDTPDFPWLSFYPEFRPRIQSVIQELAAVIGINLAAIFVAIPYALKQPSRAPREGEPFDDWANTAYLDGVAAFIDDCFSAGVSVELDLASNLWIPYSVDPRHQIGNTRYWPMPDETPWKASALWYRETIAYVERKARHPENIALWSMMGNYELGTAEPCLWDREDNPAIIASTERFVKEVWPVFRSAGTRPKAPPVMLPILSNNDYWLKKTPQARLSAFSNLRKWIIEDLALPPDYWLMTSYPFCDPAPDGVRYLEQVVEILGPENAPRILSTDLKGPGHDEVHDSIISAEGRPGTEMLEWHFQKCRQYGFAGWWIWAYQDTPASKSGIRGADGAWKMDLVQCIKRQADSDSL